MNDRDSGIVSFIIAAIQSADEKRRCRRRICGMLTRCTGQAASHETSLGAVLDGQSGGERAAGDHCDGPT